MSCCEKCTELEERIQRLEKLFQTEAPKKNEKARPDNLLVVVKYFEEQRIKDPLQQAEKFYNFYEAKGWMIGKNKVKDWKACVKTWDLPREGAIRVHNVQSKFVM